MEGVQVHVGIGGSATRCPLFCVSRQFPAADVLVSYGRETAAPSALPAASGLCKVTAIVPEDRAEGLRQCAGELYARRQNGTGPVAPQWRRFSPSAKLMVDPGCGARCAIRDTGAPGERRYHWTVTVFDETDPVAAGGALRSLRRHDRGQRAGRVAVHSLTLCLFCRRIETQCPIREGAAEDGRVTLDAAPHSARPGLIIASRVVFVASASDGSCRSAVSSWIRYRATRSSDRRIRRGTGGLSRSGATPKRRRIAMRRMPPRDEACVEVFSGPAPQYRGSRCGRA